MSFACLTPSPCVVQAGRVAPSRPGVVSRWSSTAAPRRRFAERDSSSSSCSVSSPRGASPSTATRASSSSGSSTASPFAQLETLLGAASAAANASSGDRGWREVEGAWVLAPPVGVKPRALVHFIGGAFVGASPQLTYRLFLEALVDTGDCVIVATPFTIGFEHLRIADEAQFVFDKAFRGLGPGVTNGLPVFGVGHSMGALMHMIIGSRYALTDRTANVMISFNNKPATDAVPLFAPAVAPGLRSFASTLQQINDSPFLVPLKGVDSRMRQQAPSVLKELFPVLDQIEPVFREVADGAKEFVPKPDDTKSLIRKYYSVRKNLLVRFVDDTIDETGILAGVLTDSSAISTTLDLSVKSLAGDHVRPLRQQLDELEIPKEFIEPLAQTGDAISGFAELLGIRADSSNNPLNPLGALRFGFEQVKETTLKSAAARQKQSGEGTGGDRTRVDAAAEMRDLAGEIVRFMALPPRAAAIRDAGNREQVTPTVVRE